MAVTVTVGGSTSPLDQIDESAIAQEVNRRRNDGVAVCVTIRVQEPGLDLILRSPECGGGGAGGGRGLNAEEQKVFALWDRHRLNTTEFRGGEVIAFLKQLRSLI
jgi:hypothetical protein